MDSSFPLNQITAQDILNTSWDKSQMTTGIGLLSVSDDIKMIQIFI